MNGQRLVSVQCGPCWLVTEPQLGIDYGDEDYLTVGQENYQDDCMEEASYYQQCCSVTQSRTCQIDL